ncbi:MAG: CvpA family protein [Ruminococcaceae bacterium]|nr:CvpA family protein [Oscillospiraceae bacterium]
MKGFILPTILSVLFALAYFYLAVPAINLRAFGFWFMLILTAAVFIGLYVSFTDETLIKRIKAWLKTSVSDAAQKSKKKKLHRGDYVVGDKVKMNKGIKIALIVLAAILVLVLFVTFFTSTRLFRASKYQQMLTVTESDFAEDIKELPISQIPIVDRDTAERLGSRKIGEVVELVSQFNVASYYSQINYKNKPFRVTPLEYAGFLKWFSNKDEGIPYYVTIDMAAVDKPTEQTQLVELDEGMKYSPSEYFARDLYRHMRFAYPTKMFENLSFEIDDSGAPYWVMSCYDYTIGLFGGKDITGIILVNAVNGEMTYYDISEVPQWIDVAYSAEMLITQADNWGSLKNGFLNSIFVQKNVVVTTDGYNYIAVDDDVWLYTGITSVVADESNIGFILINMRTKEAKTYMINGAEEYSAMGSAEGQVQEKGYTATFPILLNIADRPTYFISLKDEVGLVKLYAYVSVTDYQIVGVADTIQGAEKEYKRMLGISVTDQPLVGETTEYSGVIQKIATAVKNGNSQYYIMVSDKIYIADISVSDILPLLSVNDNITFKADDNGNISEISLTE